MIQLESLPQHLQTITGAEWKTLFDLLPQMEQTQSFYTVVTKEPDADGVMVMPHISNADIVEDFLKIAYQLQLVPVFDWGSWENAASLLYPPANPDLNHLDSITLCKLFTVIIRKDRFLEGFLAENFENGNVQAIIRSLQKQIQV